MSHVIFNVVVSVPDNRYSISTPGISSLVTTYKAQAVCKLLYECFNTNGDCIQPDIKSILSDERTAEVFIGINVSSGKTRVNTIAICHYAN